MSRAFVKEADDAGDELPERALSPHRNLVTAAGLARIEDELRRGLEALSAARAAGDRHAAALAERDLRYWTARRRTAELVAAPADGAIVRFGSRVTLEAGDGRRAGYCIVGEDEADPARGLISYVSPLARALLGAGVGESVPFAGGEAEIVAIE